PPPSVLRSGCWAVRTSAPLHSGIRHRMNRPPKCSPSMTLKARRADPVNATPTPPAPATRPRRWTRWLLVVSLGLNLLVIGLAAGTILRGPPDRPMAGPALGRY